MVDTRSGAVTYKVWVCVTVLNKYMGHMKAANSQTVQEQNEPGSSTAFLIAPELMGSPCPSSFEETSESEVDTADVATSMPLLPEEENEFLPRCSGHK
eukprot:g27036.t1